MWRYKSSHLASSNPLTGKSCGCYVRNCPVHACCPWSGLCSRCELAPLVLEGSVRRYRLQAKAHKGIVLVCKVAQLWVLATSNPTGDRYSCRDHALHRHTEAQSNIHSPLRWYIHPKVRSLQGGHIMWFKVLGTGHLSGTYTGS